MESLRIYLKEIRHIPLLSGAEELALAKRVKKGDEHARKKMIQSNLRLVISIAKRYMHFGTPFLDLIEEGNLGLMKAVDKFDHRKGFRFSTYAAWWIKQAITRSLSEQGKLIRVPVYMNELIAKWRKKKEEMAQKAKYIPSDAEVAKRLKLSKDKVEQINFWLASTTSSLEAPVGEEEESKVADLIQDEASDAPDAQIARLMDKERVNNLLEVMSEKERLILGRRFGLYGSRPQTLAEVAQKLGISRERVRQVEEQALRKLKKFIKLHQEEV